MKLLKLHMKGFGKFKDETLNLHAGLNVIYGLNETGKSTIHAFIEGMFYGFTDGTKKRKTYTTDHERYRPREGSYQGALEFEHKNKHYRLERTFEKRNADVRLFEMKSGQDVTDAYPLHPVRKEIDLAQFLDMPRTLFKNTLSIGQMSAATDKSARGELLRRLQNVTQTKSETLSINKALEYLDEQDKIIGTDRASTKPYRIKKDHLDTLHEEYEAAQAAHGETLEEKKRLDALASDDDALNKELNQYEEALEAIKNTKRLNQYYAIEDSLTTVQKGLEETSDEPPEMTVRFLQRAVDDYTPLFESLESNRDALLSKYSNLERVTQRGSQTHDALAGAPLSKIEEDLTRYKTFTKNLKEENETHAQCEREIAQKKTALEKAEDTVEFWSRWLTVGLPLIIAATLAAAIIPLVWMATWGGLFLLVIPIFFAVYFPQKRNHARADLDSASKALKTAEKALERSEKSLKANHEQIDKLFKAYGLEEDASFDAFYAEAKHKKEAQAEKASLEQELNTLLNTYKPVLSRFNLPREIAKLKTAFDVLKTIKRTHTVIQNTLGDKTFDAFKAAIDFSKDSVDTEREASVKEAIHSVQKTLHENALERSRKEESVASKEKSHRPLSTIRYAIEKTERELEHLTREKSILENATKRLKTVQKTIEDQFAPIMNENTEMYLKQLTEGNYESIKMKKDLSFNVLSKATGRLEHEGFFSAGTLDQIYIAMRLGILKTLKKGHYPLFMDDPFVQFDKKRLKEALKLLSSIAKDRQILLFTCHEREQQALDTLKTAYALHTLE